MNRFKILGLLFLLLATILLPSCAHVDNLDTAKPLLVAQADAAGLTYNGEAWLFGGLGASDLDILNCTQIFNPATGWRLGPDMPTWCWGSCAAELDDIAYVYGGVDDTGTYMSTCEALDLTTGIWSPKTSLPFAFRGSNAVAVAELHKIFIFVDNLVYAFDPVGNNGMGSYTRMADSPVSRRWTTCGLVNINGELRIYHIGGICVTSYPNKDLKVNYYYRPVQNDWSGPQAEAPYPADGQTGREGLVYDGTKLIYGFGEIEGSRFFGDLYTYDAATNKFSALLAVGTPRDGVNSSIIHGILYVMGGRNTMPFTKGLDLNELFYLESAPPSS
jgi:hypothetical protein